MPILPVALTEPLLKYRVQTFLSYALGGASFFLSMMTIFVAAATITAGVIIGNRLVGNLGPVDRLLLLWGAIGLLAGAGIGFGYVCPIAALVKWFPRSKGLVSGIAVAGFGFGAFIFTSPYLPFSAENFIQEYGITRTFMVHGLVCLLGVGGGAMLLRNPPKVEAVASASPSPQGGGASPAAASNDFTWRETLRTPAFYALWFMFFSGAMAGLMIIGVLKEFAGEQLVRGAMAGGGSLSDEARTSLLQQGAEAVGWLAIFNAVGRVAWGSASDRIGRTGAFIAMFLLQAAVLLSLCVMDWRPELAGPWTLAIAASLIGFNFGGNFALFPSATADRFGPTNLGANYGWLYTSYGIAGLVGVAVGNFARTQTGSYTVALLVAAVLCIFAAGLAVLLTRMDRRPKDAADPGVAPA